MESSQVYEIETLEIIDLKHFFSLLRRRFWLLLLCLLLGGIVAFGVSRYQTPVYEADTQVMVTRSSSSNSAIDLTQTLNSQQLSQTYIELLSRKWVQDDVSQRIGGEIDENQIKISAAPNTLVINITVEDPDPARASLIADTLVQVLVAQNEALQSSRYNDAERGLNLQIQQVQGQLTDIQSQLDLVRAGAYEDKLADAEKKIEATQANISAAQAEIEDLSTLSTSRAQALLQSSQARLEQLHAALDEQLNIYQDMETKLQTDPAIAQDQAAADALQAQMAEQGVTINNTRDEIATLEDEIDWLTPLTVPDALDSALENKEKYLATQQKLLESYQEIYTNLLVTGEVQVDTDEIAKLEKNLDLYQQIFLNLTNNLETVRLEKMQNVPNVVQINPALPSDEPVRPRILLNTVLGAVAGLVLAVAFVLLADFLDTTLKTSEDIERTLNLPVLGYVLQLDKNLVEQDGPYVLHAPRSPVAEAFRSLRTNLEFIGIDQPLKSILISSSGTAEGKTTVAANLAAAMAQSDKRVVLVDADLRRPRLHRELGLTNSLGLSDVFRERVSLRDIYQLWPDLPLTVITSGGIPPNPAELLGSEKMRQILEELEAQFDFVVIDSTPTIVTDSQLIAARVDGVLLVLWPGRTHAEAARAAVEGYRRVGARLLGVVMNNVKPSQSYGGYTPYSYYQYATQEKGLQLPWQRSRSVRKDKETSE